MLEWAEHQFKLRKPNKDGVSEGDHLRQLEKQLGFTPEGLTSPVAFPKLLEYLWVTFNAISRRRQSGFNGPQPISPEQILAWKTLRQYPLSPWEVETIEALDDIYLKVSYG